MKPLQHRARIRRTAATLIMMGALHAACAPGPSPLERFEAAPAERFYRIEIDGALAGRMHEESLRSTRGAPIVRITTIVDLPGAGRLVRRDSRRFAAQPPHPLTASTIWIHGPDGEITERDRMGEDDEPTDLAQQLAVHDTETTDEYRIGTSFLVQRTDVLPQLPDRPDASASIALRLPIAIRRPDSGRIESLGIRVHGPAGALFTARPGLDVSRDTDTTLVTTTRLGDPGADPDAVRRSREVMRSVREQIDYVPGATPPDLQALLRTGEGDCWEFAMLFDALATAAGLDTRIVNGLAWSEATAGAFVPHAWNQVRIGTQWMSVDPTWGRIGADAARLPYPEDAAAQLDIQIALARSSLEVVSINAGTTDATAASGPVARAAP